MFVIALITGSLVALILAFLLLFILEKPMCPECFAATCVAKVVENCALQETRQCQVNFYLGSYA